ncbi:hypothetical protein J2S11_004354 [Bacillus horti]|uniref:Uncharacterized protein n=1 Tax=Caldalkalibacillus horti TaxID=77523 RepID=A0ABT9W5N9_9BACI|nr:hypothetical protein [Bacillus horti]
MIKKTESSVLSKAGLIKVDRALESWHDARLRFGNCCR